MGIILETLLHFVLKKRSMFKFVLKAEAKEDSERFSRPRSTSYAHSHQNQTGYKKIKPVKEN